MQIVLISLVFILVISGSSNGQTLYMTAEGGIGAVYTMSNGATMNQVLIHRMNATGYITMVSAISGNGTGVNSTGVDALGSQGSVVVYSNYLFVVNPGSNSLSMFWINPADATQLKLLSVQATMGLFPISVAVNSMYACVLTTGNITGIRCFNYNSSGLFPISAFDRNLTSYISSTISLTAPPGGFGLTFSQIMFSPDNRSLIVLAKGNATVAGFLLFYLFNDNKTVLSSNATTMVLTGAMAPFAVLPVGANGLFIVDGALPGVATLNYSSTTGMISNLKLTHLNDTLAAALCWSAYSPALDTYYGIAAGAANVVALKLNLSSNSTPVQVIQYFQLPPNTGGLDAIVVSLPGKDYLYVTGVLAHVVTGYRLDGSANASLINVAPSQIGDTSNLPKLVGTAAFIQTQSSSSATTGSPSATTAKPSAAASFIASTVTTILSMTFILFASQ